MASDDEEIANLEMMLMAAEAEDEAERSQQKVEPAKGSTKGSGSSLFKPGDDSSESHVALRRLMSPHQCFVIQYLVCGSFTRWCQAPQ